MDILLALVVVLLAAFIALGAVLIVRALLLKPTPIVNPLPASNESGDDKAVERFREMLRCETVWARGDRKPFDDFVPLLKQLYPLSFSHMDLHLVNTYGIVLHWHGTDPHAAPIVLMAHHDVVDVKADEWTHAPFGAEIADGRIYARGALDTKCILACLLEASQKLLGQGYTPPCDVFIVSGNTEETSGSTMPMIVDWFEERDIRPRFVIDEGGSVLDKVPFGVKCALAAIGVSEKGYADLRITTHSAGGHASMPSDNDATTKLVDGLHNLQHSRTPSRLDPSTVSLAKELAAHSTFGMRLLFGNLWLFKPRVLHVLDSSPLTASMTHTTYALTELEGSPAPNVIPRQASATLNIRADMFDDSESALAHIRPCFDDQTTYVWGSVDEPVGPSPCVGENFEYLRRITDCIYPDIAIAPYMQSSGGDGRQFCRICDSVYRFAGIMFANDQIAAMHDNDESLDVSSFKKGVGFYTELIRHLDMLTETKA